MDKRTYYEGYDHGSEDARKGLPKRYRPIRATGPNGEYRAGYDAGYGADHALAFDPDGTLYDPLASQAVRSALDVEVRDDQAAEAALREINEAEAAFVAPDNAEAQRLVVEHGSGDGHTGDRYVTGCPTCDPEGWQEAYQ